MYGITNMECHVQNIENIWNAVRAMFNDLANSLTLCMQLRLHLMWRVLHVAFSSL